MTTLRNRSPRMTTMTVQRRSRKSEKCVKGYAIRPKMSVLQIESASEDEDEEEEEEEDDEEEDSEEERRHKKTKKRGRGKRRRTARDFMYDSIASCLLFSVPFLFHDDQQH